MPLKKRKKETAQLMRSFIYMLYQTFVLLINYNRHKKNCSMTFFFKEEEEEKGVFITVYILFPVLEKMHSPRVNLSLSGHIR